MKKSEIIKTFNAVVKSMKKEAEEKYPHLSTIYDYLVCSEKQIKNLKDSQWHNGYAAGLEFVAEYLQGIMK